jgi:BirA family transcriptional regulator, biotin operon repressor / biotin---[acetyl-CoA-carboxylase] ligase
MSLQGDPLPSDLAEALEASRSRVAPLCRRVLFLRCTGSTNDDALAMAEAEGAEGLVIIADEQTKGRGRRGRVWHSPPASGLYVSLLLRPPLRDGDLRPASLLTLAAGVALAEGIEAAAGLRADIKWPNDLLVGRRKLAGILAESAAPATRFVVLGYGINVTARAFPPDLERATSVEVEIGRPIDRAVVCIETLAALARRYTDLRHGRFDAILDAWRDRSPSSRNARVAWETPSGRVSGLTGGIDDAGALIVRVGNRLDRIVGGALTWLD